jgi:hypothetical protein
MLRRAFLIGVTSVALAIPSLSHAQRMQAYKACVAREEAVGNQRALAFNLGFLENPFAAVVGLAETFMGPQPTDCTNVLTDAQRKVVADQYAKTHMSQSRYEQHALMFHTF